MYAYEAYPGNGATTQFTIPFPYIAQEHVEVYVDAVLQTLGSDYTYLNSSTVSFTVAPANGTTIGIRRNTKKDIRIVDFQDAAILTENALDQDSDQLLYIAQETLDTAEGWLLLDSDNTYEASNRRVKNLADPVDAQDAATKAYAQSLFTGESGTPIRTEIMADLAASSGSSIVGFIQSGTGAVARTAQDKGREVVSVKDFGAVGDGVADDLAAFNAAIASVKAIAGIRANGTHILVPPGTYKLSGRLVIDNTITLEGMTNQFPYATGSAVLQFSADNDGLFLGYYTGAYANPSGVMGQGITIRNLTIKGTKASGTGHGIFINTKANIENVYVTGFSGHGVYIYGDAPNGNANNCLLKNVKAYSNGKSGFYTAGGDSNACLIEICDGSYNAEWGFHDSSFLGNTYIGCHSADNALGAYKADGPSSRNVFIGCYSESGQPVSSIDHPSVVIGGLHAAGFTDAGTGFVATDGIFSGFTTTKAPVTHQTANAAGTSVTVYSALGSRSQPSANTWGSSDDSAGGEALSWTYNDAGSYAGWWSLKHAFSDAKVLMRYPGSVAIASASVNKARAWAPIMWNGIMFQGESGFPSAAVIHNTGSAAPITETWSRGDIIYNTTPAAGGFIGWVCVAGGTPGTWKTFGAITA
jgi:hypothetical protein